MQKMHYQKKVSRLFSWWSIRNKKEIIKKIGTECIHTLESLKPINNNKLFGIKLLSALSIDLNENKLH